MKQKFYQFMSKFLSPCKVTDHSSTDHLNINANTVDQGIRAVYQRERNFTKSLIYIVTTKVKKKLMNKI